MSKIFLVLLLATVVAQTLAQPADLSEHDKKCYDQECPNTTTACKKVIETSADKKTLNTDIFCLDAEDAVLREHHKSDANPFGSGTTFQSTSYSGTYVSHGGGPFNININNNVDPLNNNNVEDFS